MAPGIPLFDEDCRSGPAVTALSSGTAALVRPGEATLAAPA